MSLKTILSITNLASNAALNAKMKETEGGAPSITNLATNAALTAVEDDVSDLVKKKQIMMQKYQK